MTSMGRYLVLWAALLAGTCLSQVVGEDYRFRTLQALNSLKGVVTYSDRPAAHALLQLHAIKVQRPPLPELSETTADEEGHFDFLHLSPGIYRVVIRYTAKGRRTPVVNEVEVRIRGPLEIECGAGGVTIQLRERGRPLVREEKRTGELCF